MMTYILFLVVAFLTLSIAVGAIAVIQWIIDTITGDRKKRVNAKQELASLQSQIAEARNSVELWRAQLNKTGEDLSALEAHKASVEKKTEEEISALEARKASIEKKLGAAEKKLVQDLEIMRSIQHAADTFHDRKYNGEQLLAEGIDASFLEPTTSEALMCLQIRELRRLYSQNRAAIRAIIAHYQNRYTTKTLSTICQLMVLALEAEMQNVLYKLRFGRLEAAIDQVKELTARYYAIAVTGNQTISSTLIKMIGQLEYHYIEAVKIEYEYYIKRERAREEQRALKEQMRQEAEERRILEEQQKKLEAEEAKFQKELARIADRLEAAQGEEMDMLRAQLGKVQSQLDAVQGEREQILHLQNGKAGTVYVISNIGSFGEDVFKIGMTRRLEPMDRIKELSSASVPFPFDVHSFIFSEDAVALETRLHHILNNDRVNKINRRKEFFRVNLDRLQEIVEACDPSAAFSRTALAEQFRQSQSIDEVPENPAIADEETDEEPNEEWAE